MYSIRWLCMLVSKLFGWKNIWIFILWYWGARRSTTHLHYIIMYWSFPFIWLFRSNVFRVCSDIKVLIYIYIFGLYICVLFSCDQAALQMVFSLCLSVTPFWLCSHHRIIMKFSGVITNDQSKVHAKGQGQRSKVKVTEVTTQLNGFRTVTPVWIHICWWNDAYSFMLLRRGALLFLKVIRQISRSHGSKNCRIWTKLAVSGL